MEKKRSLTYKQKLFVNEYLANGFNATQAAIKAGYSVKTAGQQAARLLKNVKIKEMLAKRVREILTETEMMTLQWLKQVKNIAEYDMRKAAIWDDSGLSLRPSESLDDATALAIQEVQYNQTDSGVTMKIKSYDKVRALEQIAKFLGVIGDGFTLDEVSVERKVETGDLTPAQRRDRIAELYAKIEGTD
jgi:phage terminase small subunit